MQGGANVDGPTPRERAYFIGGDMFHDATTKRIGAFRHALTLSGHPCKPDQIIACGYTPDVGYRAIQTVLKGAGGVPSLIFINSQTILVGIMEHLVQFPDAAFANSVIGCWDYHPLAAALKFPMHMVRQNTQGMIAEDFGLIDKKKMDPQVIKIKTELLRPREILHNVTGDLG
ncbi:hypothetical protein R3X27_07650 [Tropicimonas sp. TH_r6]|uniref:hypothetical protein n=1 Tax=Tropicimonas sp. TH_r6 TaxID=3082085 RepID=UPI002955D23C|nr:hypothetical protein [Tropicimonas sp. TH_r6]MDV7142555.1 hypothetical protein [Tropicimonas sp. TH_r6]